MSPTDPYGSDDDLETGSGKIHDLGGNDPNDSASLWNVYNKPFVPTEKEPIAADLDSALQAFRAIGANFTQRAAVLRTAVATEKPDTGTVAELLKSILDSAYARIRPILITIAVLLAVILLFVKLHRGGTVQNRQATAPAQGEANDQAGATQSEQQDFQSDTNLAYGPASPVSQSGQTAATRWSQQTGIQASSAGIPVALKFEVASLITQMQLDGDHSLGVQAGPLFWNEQWMGAGVVSTNSPHALSANMLQLPSQTTTAAPTPQSDAGVGLKQPGLDEPDATADYANPVVYSNGDENAIMQQLYNEYADNRNSISGRQAGTDLAAIYWLRARGAFHDGQQDAALRDWKSVIKFDSTDPIAIQARTRITMYREGLLSSGSAAQLQVGFRTAHSRLSRVHHAKHHPMQHPRA
jgi:hypothetical protein